MVFDVAGYCIGGYLLGSLAFCQLLAHSRGTDLGDNLGAATYVKTTGDVRGGVMCGLADAAKGGIAYFLFGPVGGVCAVVGHMWSAFFGFRGGRGGATAAGVLALMDPFLLLLFALYTALRAVLIRDQRVRERFDQGVRVALLLVLPFSGYPNWWVVEGMLLASTIKYASVGVWPSYSQTPT